VELAALFATQLSAAVDPGGTLAVGTLALFVTVN